MAYPGSFMEEQGYGILDEENWLGNKQQGGPASQGTGVGSAGVQATSPPYAVSAASAGSYGYLGTQAQPAFVGGGFPTAKPPPTFPPPQPPASMGPPTTTGQADVGFNFQKKEAIASSAPAPGRLGQPDLARVLHTQPPPPPSQAPQVPPTQSPAPQGPPPCAPPLMSPPSQPAPSASTATGDGLADDARKKEEMLYLTTPEAEKAAREKYGLLGILKVIRMTDPDLNTLALGMDLTTLGLNLNSPECLYSTFASPWSDTPARKDPDFFLPPCYYMNPPQLKQAHLQKFSLETLFYIFFNMPRDTLQAYAAAELYNRGWKYHRDLKTWFIYQEEEGHARWVCFDLNTWEKHYYLQEVNVNSFLSEDDVRVKMPPPGQMPPPAPATG